MATATAKRPMLKGSMMDKLRRAFAAKDEAGFEETMNEVETTAEEQGQADLANMIGEAVAGAIGPAISEAIAPIAARLDDVDAFVTDRKAKDAAFETEEQERKRKEAETKDSKTKDNDALFAFLKGKGMSDEDCVQAVDLMLRSNGEDGVPTNDDSSLANPEPDGSNDPGTNGTNTATNPDVASSQGSTGPGNLTAAAAQDSASLLAVFRDTVAKAEILAPGVKLPAYDAKAKAISTADAMCALRRRALQSAFDSADRKIHVAPFVDAAPDFKKMTCDAIKTVFAGAAELDKRGNAPSFTTDAAPLMARNAGTRDSIAEMNAAAAALWKPVR